MAPTALLDDRYRLGDPLGRGGACDVFVARDERLQRDVAVKVLRGEGIGDAGRMATEAQLLASFNHPGLVQVFDAGEVDGQPYVVLELVDGDTLADRLRTGPLPPAQVAAIGVAVADALAFVHARGVVHRDVSPANVLCGIDGRTCLADFGVARLVDEAGRTSASVALGTPAYMAPEQVRGLTATPGADIYALGLVLAESLTGRRAFEGSGTAVALARLTRSPDVSSGVPEAWRPLLMAMTVLEPRDRPTALEVRDGLVQVMTRTSMTTAVVAPVAATVDGADEDHDAATAPTTETPTESRAAPSSLSGSTAVLPIAPFPVDAGRRDRRLLVAVLVAFLVVLGAGLAHAGGHDDGSDVPPTSTAPVSTDPVVNVPSTTAVTAPASTSSPEPKGKAKGRKAEAGD